MDRPDRPTRRRLPPEERRASILAAAAEAFARQAYDEVGVASIADAAGVSEALVHRYFEGKAGLYAEVVRGQVSALAEAERAAQQELPERLAVRERIKVGLEVLLDHIADHPEGWAPPLRGAGTEPEEAVTIRREARASYVAALRRLIGVHGWRRHDYAVEGTLGFLDAACLAWAEAGCPPEDRGHLVEATLGALEGALGDWGKPGKE